MIVVECAPMVGAGYLPFKGVLNSRGDEKDITQLDL